MLQYNPYLDKVWHFGKDFHSLTRALRAENFDYLIDLHKNLRSHRLRHALGVTSYSFPKANLEKWLMVNFKIDWLPRQHIVERYMVAVAPLEVTYDGEGLDCFLPKEAVFERSRFGLDPSKPYIAFAIGAAHATKRLPTEKITEICRQLPLKTVLIGGPTEQPTGDTIAANTPQNAINACGHLTLHQSADALRQATLVISHDTGMMHLAAALRKKIVSIWGSTIPAFGMRPFFPEGVNNHATIEVRGLSCRPCSKIGYDRCPKGHFKCMTEVDIAEVVRAVKAILSDIG